MIKLLDFWAPWCISPETLVLTENGYLPASQIKLGMKLLTYNPKSKKQNLKEVKKTEVFGGVPSKRITLETGRELVGDNNHQVFTKNGFKKLEDLTLEDQVLVDPIRSDLVVQPNDDHNVIFSTNHTFSDKHLYNLNLLPLKSSNPKLVILAKLLGFVMTDGYLYEDLKHNTYETHFYAGQEVDASEIKRDLEILGFDRLEIKRQTKERQAGNRKYIINTLRCRNLNRSLFFLLKALGAPVGRKKNNCYFVPDWIMEGSEDLKRAFLAGWLGGDGCKISYRVRHQGDSSHYAHFNVNSIEFHKEKYLEREGVLYAKQLGILLEELGVKVTRIESSDDEDGVIIYLAVATDYTSLLNLTQIGYAYSNIKNSTTPFIKEFLRYRLLEKSRYTEKKVLVLQQIALGAMNRDIAQSLQIPLRTVVSWKYTDSQSVHPPENGQARFDKWLENRQQGSLLWESVTQIEDVDDQDVIGITVGNPHTIITNGIISHNCGPCRIMNPIIEELEKELEGKVEVVKINVDEKPDEAAKYEVMSIPTYIILKDNKEVGRKIGVTSRQDLLKLING